MSQSIPSEIKYWRWISSKWPQLRSTARRTSEMQGLWRRMSTVRHMRGSMQMFRQREHTRSALLIMPKAPTFSSIFAVTSRGSSSQLGVVAVPSWSPLVDEDDAIVQIERRTRIWLWWYLESSSSNNEANQVIITSKPRFEIWKVSQKLFSISVLSGSRWS